MTLALMLLVLQAPFADVPPAHWAAGAVANMKAEGVLLGYPPEKTHHFVFLVTGKGKPPVDEKELQAMQDAHIGNFKRRHAEGLVVAAGPLRDSGKSRRGIVVLSLRQKYPV